MEWMPTTKDFKFLLERKNVIGVSWEEKDKTLIVNVSKKMDEQDLDEDDIVSNALSAQGYQDIEVDVRDAGLGEDAPGFEPMVVTDEAEEQVTTNPRKDRFRPVETGCSEINWRSTAATGGHYPVIVENTDIDSAEWWDSVEEGDLMRLSNNHVYALSNNGSLGESTLQPSPSDGGRDPEDISGKLAGYVPIENGVTVDCAVRSTESVEEVGKPIGLPERYGKEVERNITPDHKGRQVVKSGRTTGVERGIIKQTSASLLVNYGGDIGSITLDDQVVCSSISRPGDSGSPVYFEGGDEDGALAFLLFAGSSSETIVNKISNVEKEHGVKVLPTDYEPTKPTAQVNFELEKISDSEGGDGGVEKGKMIIDVKESGSGNPLQGAQIIAESTKEDGSIRERHIRRTNEQGKASIDGLIIDDFIVEASKTGYSPSSKNVLKEDFN